MAKLWIYDEETADWVKANGKLVDEGGATERYVVETVPVDEDGNPIPVGSPTDPVNVREPACFVSITPSSLTTNVFTVTGAPAKGIEVINDSAGDITVTVSDGITSIAKTLKPDDIYSQTFSIGVETVTFSEGAVFRADLLR